MHLHPHHLVIDGFTPAVDDFKLFTLLKLSDSEFPFVEVTPSSVTFVDDYTAPGACIRIEPHEGETFKPDEVAVMLIAAQDYYGTMEALLPLLEPGLADGMVFIATDEWPSQIGTTFAALREANQPSV